MVDVPEVAVVDPPYDEVVTVGLEDPAVTNPHPGGVGRACRKREGENDGRRRRQAEHGDLPDQVAAPGVGNVGFVLHGWPVPGVAACSSSRRMSARPRKQALATSAYWRV